MQQSLGAAALQLCCIANYILSLVATNFHFPYNKLFIYTSKVSLALHFEVLNSAVFVCADDSHTQRFRSIYFTSLGLGSLVSVCTTDPRMAASQPLESVQGLTEQVKCGF